MIASKREEGPPHIPFYKHITKLEGLLSTNDTECQVVSLVHLDQKAASDVIDHVVHGFWGVNS